MYWRMSYIGHSGHHPAVGRYAKPHRTVAVRIAYTTPRASWLHGTQFALGVDDVFDEDPPRNLDHPVGFSYGTIARPQGRFWRMTIKRSW